MGLLSRRRTASGPGLPRPHPFLLVQAATVVAVSALLGLLVWRVAHRTSGAALVRSVARGAPARAPAFSLPVIWRRDEYWPVSLRHALDHGIVTLAEFARLPGGRQLLGLVVHSV